MKEIRFSIAKLTEAKMSYGGTKEIYIYWFRTNWMDEVDARQVSHELQQAFPAPRWKITRETKETRQTTETLS
jgi:hypothetical protein